MLPHQRRHARHSIVERLGVAAMVASQDHQHYRLVLDKNNSRVIGDERLAVAGLVSDGHVPQVFRKTIIDLLLLQGSQHPLAGASRHQLFLLNHFEQMAEVACRAVSEINPGIVDRLAKRVFYLAAAEFIKGKLQGLVPGALL